MKMNSTRSAHNCLAITDAGPYCASMALPGRSYCAEHLADRCGETVEPAKAKPVKFNLTRERLNSGGYTARGRYFGVGAPLYYYSDYETGELANWIRASSREDAKAIVRSKYPGAVFFN